MYTLGIGGSNHDFSAALVKDGKLIVAIEDERLTRKKHGDRRWMVKPTSKSIKYCLDYAQIEIGDIDNIYVNDDLENIDLLKLPRVIKIGHHLAHACSSFFLSPFDQSCLLIADGCGGPTSSSENIHLLETISLGFATDRQIDLKVHQTGVKHLSSSNWTYRNSNSLGVFYRVVSVAIGFSNRGEGKTMGLAAYGNSSLVSEMREFVTIEKGHPFEFNPYNGIYDWISQILREDERSFKKKADLAYAAQFLFEEAILNTADTLRKNFQSKNLCLGGGCALNCSANGKIRASGLFENLFVFPPAGDNGLAIGAAFYGDFIKRGKLRKPMTLQEVDSSCYTGRLYKPERVRKALETSSFSFYKPEDLTDELSYLLSLHEVIALCNGRSEIGPRALGNRSILASPFREETRDRINLLVKNRESFRPLAPMVLEEDVDIYFDFKGKSPFMLEAVNVKKEYRRKLAAITHFDGTARIQTVSNNGNRFLYELLHRFKEITGHGVLLNTSFNLRGQPIVETPEDALDTFSKMPINRLVLFEYMVEKHSPWETRYLLKK